MKSFVSVSLIFLCQSALAYLPDYHMIMSRVAENHGRNIHQIYQDIVCQAEPEPYIIREIWTVSSENSLRVTFSGKGLLKDQAKGTIVYRNRQRYFIGSDGKVRTSRPGQDFNEDFFHFRYSKNIKPKLVAMGFVGSESLKPRKLSFTEEEQPLYESQNFLRLGRTLGRVAYVVGSPPPEGATKPKEPALWVEQDRFNILKIRMPSMSEIEAEDYQKHRQRLYFPRTRRYIWNGNVCEAQLDKVEYRGTGAIYRKILKPESLQNENTMAKATEFPQIQVLREFYSRFR